MRCAIALLVALLLGCAQSAPTTTVLAQSSPAPRPHRVCADLANSFYLVADQMNRGVSKEDQIVMAKRATRKPGSKELREQWLRVIDLVYRFADGSAEEIGYTVLDRCYVNKHGQAVVTTLWPAP